MKILHAVEYYHPSVGGMQEVVRQLSERLAALGHEMTVVTTAIPGRTLPSFNGVTIREFSVTGNWATGMQGETEQYRDFLRRERFDVIAFFAAQQWTTDAALDLLDELSAKKVFVPTGFSGLPYPAFADYFKSMPEWMKKFDMNVFLSDDYRDIHFAREHGVVKFMIVPNGASEEEFTAPSTVSIRNRFRIGGGQFFLLHVGSYTGIKGHREAISIYLNSKNKNSVLMLAGSHLSSLRKNLWRLVSFSDLMKWIFTKGKRIIIADLNRQETVDAFREADLFLFPSNIECSPLVIFEAAAAGTPFLSSDVGNSKELADWLKSGEILPTVIDSKGYSYAKIPESARMLDNLIDQPEKLRAMGEAGFRNWKAGYTWNVIAKKYEALYRSLTEKS